MGLDKEFCPTCWARALIYSPTGPVYSVCIYVFRQEEIWKLGMTSLQIGTAGVCSLLSAKLRPSIATWSGSRFSPLFSHMTGDSSSTLFSFCLIWAFGDPLPNVTPMDDLGSFFSSPFSCFPSLSFFLQVHALSLSLFIPLSIFYLSFLFVFSYSSFFLSFPIFHFYFLSLSLFSSLVLFLIVYIWILIKMNAD